MPFPSVTYSDVPVLDSGADAILLVVAKSDGSEPDPAGWDG